ncbi:helix-turn-helix domain-containing protein [Phenylobacterium sp. J426]|uniref:helix-turn-helix domain-containing protein n=1 Tax=Phenylobacterium sp. J426 TaxID=2898439 RepID=UPI0021519BB9|nr:helix-turn-helix transcriptional regulator [Phenylobacterium sp. J426]MCR5876545.1 helix-turn-helix domain-containing protein [Phenylobacterium sp. J426]
MASEKIRSRDPIEVRIGARIRVRRRALRLSQRRLGERVGVTFQQIQKYESGSQRLSVVRLLAIAGALDCSVGELLDLPGGGLEAVSVYEPATEEERVLCEAFTQISDPRLRRTVLALVAQLAALEVRSASGMPPTSKRP